MLKELDINNLIIQHEIQMCFQQQFCMMIKIACRISLTLKSFTQQVIANLGTT